MLARARIYDVLAARARIYDALAAAHICMHACSRSREFMHVDELAKSAIQTKWQKQRKSASNMLLVTSLHLTSYWN